MTEYLLHIGPPKTGTKYLQNAFATLAPKLLDDGICYPADLWSGPEHFSHQQIVNGIKSGQMAQVEEMFENLNRSKHEIILLSCEGFTSFKKDEVQLLRRLMGGRDARIVFYCRRWSDWLPSAWQESVRQGSRLMFPEFLSRLMAAPSFEQEINFSITLDLFADIFGKSSIILGSYSNVKDDGGDVLRDFLQNILGKTYDTCDIASSLNESAGAEHTELLRILNVVENQLYDSNGIPFKLAVERMENNVEIESDLDIIYKGIHRNLVTMMIDDNAPWLRSVYIQILHKYRENLSGDAEDSQLTALFAKKKREFQYAGCGYLLDRRVSEAIKRVHHAARLDLLAA